MPTVPRIDRKLPDWAAAEVAALQAAHALRFRADDVADCHALFLDAIVQPLPGSTIKPHRFPLRRAMQLAREVITTTAREGGDLATTAAGTLYILAKRGEGT